MSVLEIPPRTTTIWELCCFCQGTKAEKLVCPHEKKQYHKSYDTVETDIDNFIKNEVPLPFHMTKECLIVPSHKTVSKSLLEKKAVFHKTCRDLVRGKEIVRFKDRQEKKSRRKTSMSLVLAPRRKQDPVLIQVFHDPNDSAFAAFAMKKMTARPFTKVEQPTKR